MRSYQIPANAQLSMVTNCIYMCEQLIEAKYLSRHNKLDLDFFVVLIVTVSKEVVHNTLTDRLTVPYQTKQYLS